MRTIVALLLGQGSVTPVSPRVDQALLAIVRLSGSLVIFAAVAKVWRWPDPASLELLPLFSLPTIWTAVAVVELAIGIIIALAGAHRVTIAASTVLASLFLTVNAYLYLSNHRDCPCLGNLRIGTLGMALGESALLISLFTLAAKSSWDVSSRYVAKYLAIGVIFGGIVLVLGRSSNVFVVSGKIDAILDPRSRLKSTALYAGSSAPGEACFVDVEIVAGVEPIVVTGYAFSGSRPSERLPMLVPARTRQVITLEYDAIQRAGEYLLPGYLFTNHDQPDANKFFISGCTGSFPKS